MYKNPLRNELDKERVYAYLPRISVMDETGYIQKYIRIERKSYHPIKETYICVKISENYFDI